MTAKQTVADDEPRRLHEAVAPDECWCGEVHLEEDRDVRLAPNVEVNIVTPLFKVPTHRVMESIQKWWDGSPYGNGNGVIEWVMDDHKFTLTIDHIGP